MSRISALKSKIDTLRVKIIGLQMTPDYKYLESLKNEIVGLEKEVCGKQITIDALEFDVDSTEKRVKNGNEIIIKLGKEIDLLKQRVNCREEDIVSLINKLHRANINLKDANESIITLNTNIKISEDKKITNRLKKLFVS